MSNELSNTEKAKIVFSIIKGDLTIEDVCASTSVAADVLQSWIDDAIASVGSRRAVYEKLGKIKACANMFVFPGGSLACIRLHDREELHGAKSDYWSSAVQLADLADGEVIFSFSSSRCRLEEIDIVFPRLCLPPQFAGNETETSKFSVEMELDFKRKTAKIRFARPDRIQTQNGPLSSIRFVMPPPLVGTVFLSVDDASRRLYNIEISHANKSLPVQYFAPD